MSTPRNIVTTYFDHKGKELRINRASGPREATRAAFDHLQMDHYKARVASIHDDNMGELHAILKIDVHGDIRSTFKRDPRTPTCIMMPPKRKSRK